MNHVGYVVMLSMACGDDRSGALSMQENFVASLLANIDAKSLKRFSGFASTTKSTWHRSKRSGSIVQPRATESHRATAAEFADSSRAFAGIVPAEHFEKRIIARLRVILERLADRQPRSCYVENGGRVS